MNVSAIIVTRGNVDLQPIIDSIPQGWEIVIWDNGARLVSRSDGYAEVATDLSVYGRYAAIEYATHDIIYVQDDDCVVSDPRAIVERLVSKRFTPNPALPGLPDYEAVEIQGDLLVSNMPESRWPDFPDSALVGWGAAFHRDLPKRCFDRYGEYFGQMDPTFNRTCDVVFSALAPARTIVDYGFSHLPWAEGPGRMFTTNYAEHKRERDAMLALARKVRGS